jgi:hypothetical protein
MPNTAEEEDRKYPWPDPDSTRKIYFFYRIRIHKAQKIYRHSRRIGSGILKEFENVVKNS